MAGLTAAQTLLARGVADVLIVEASHHVGGRVRQVEGVAPWPLEAGPEFVHGANNSLVNVLTEHAGLKLHEREWPDWVYMGDDQKLLAAKGANTELMGTVNRLMFEEVCAAPAVIYTHALSFLCTLSERA